MLHNASPIQLAEQKVHNVIIAVTPLLISISPNVSLIISSAFMNLPQCMHRVTYSPILYSPYQFSGDKRGESFFPTMTQRSISPLRHGTEGDGFEPPTAGPREVCVYYAISASSAQAERVSRTRFLPRRSARLSYPSYRGRPELNRYHSLTRRSIPALRHAFRRERASKVT